MRAVHVNYFTDPGSPHSWAAEPGLRRVLTRFGDGVEISYVMGGHARAIDDPMRMLRDVLAAAAGSDMPVDPRLWLEHPPQSTYPSCMAVKAAAEQGLEVEYLRRAREGFMVERRTLCRNEALVDLARTVPGLDVRKFAIDIGSDAIVESFSADLERRRALAGERELPFVQIDGLEGPRDVADLERLLEETGAEASDPPPVPAALKRFARMATAEVAAVCELPGPLAAAELWQLAAQWKVRVERCVGGELWAAA